MTDNTRANKITVATVAGELTATFWRTHKKLITVTAEDIGYVENEQLNATANRELFRVYAIENTEGISYDPTDRRTDANRFPSHWTDEDMVGEWAEKMVLRDASKWAEKMGVQCKVSFVGLSDEVRYENKDAIKEATVECDLRLYDAETDEGCDLLVTLFIKSGQMTKPKQVSSDNWNFTNTKALAVAEMPSHDGSHDKPEDMTVKELKQHIKDNGLEIKGISKMTRLQLIDAIKKC